MASALATRLATGIVLIVVVLVALFVLPLLAFGIVLLIAVAGIGFEWAALIGIRALSRTLFTMLVFVLGAVLLWLCGTRGFDAIAPIACGIATLGWIALGIPSVFANWQPSSIVPRAIFAIVALEGAFVAIVALRAHSPWLALAAMAIVWIADTAAYFAGRSFGRRKLASTISPGKTWEGAYGAVVAVAAYALALVPLARRAGFEGSIDASSIVAWVAFAVAIAALSIIGDLHESLLKRRAGAKDSGALLPGHGGILDRTDALLAAMPPVAIVATLILGPA
ncbi:MAG TPA: phosphatidate cytidylyltransferase [Casimicrobiaceae bacterium]|nr:phosphatidate cytidylyltransferase [Casimicrobiaceae bacterium]